MTENAKTERIVHLFNNPTPEHIAELMRHVAALLDNCSEEAELMEYERLRRGTEIYTSDLAYARMKYLARKHNK